MKSNLDLFVEHTGVDKKEIVAFVNSICKEEQVNSFEHLIVEAINSAQHLLKYNDEKKHHETHVTSLETLDKDLNSIETELTITAPQRFFAAVNNFKYQIKHLAIHEKLIILSLDFLIGYLWEKRQVAAGDDTTNENYVDKTERRKGFMDYFNLEFYKKLEKKSTADALQDKTPTIEDNTFAFFKAENLDNNLRKFLTGLGFTLLAITIVAFVLVVVAMVGTPAAPMVAGMVAATATAASFNSVALGVFISSIIVGATGLFLGLNHVQAIVNADGENPLNSGIDSIDELTDTRSFETYSSEETAQLDDLDEPEENNSYTPR